MNKVDRIIEIQFNGIDLNINDKNASSNNDVNATVLIDSYIKGDKGDKGDRGPQGFDGSIDNFVVLTEYEYSRLTEIDPNKFYFTYEGEGPTPPEPPTPTGDVYIDVENHIIIGAIINETTFVTEGIISNNILNV